MPTADQIRTQSNAAYKQWATQWREQSKQHSKLEMKSLLDFENIGVGKACLVIANGYSLEENIDIIKANQGKVDIMVCDKTLGACLDAGIKPTYCFVCDANVSYQKYLEPWREQVSDIVFFNNVCGNPRWTFEAKWKSTYLYANKDVIHSEVEFMKLSGCPNSIPAATNVSNAMVVMLTQSDNAGRNNFFGYDKILLIGFDYSWRVDGKYYAFNADGGGKANYMRHIYLQTFNGEDAYSSGNLVFSAEWLDKYIRTFKLNVIQCSKSSVLSAMKFGDLAQQMQYEFRPGDADKVRYMIENRNNLAKQVIELERKLKSLGRDHYFQYLATT